MVEAVRRARLLRVEEERRLAQRLVVQLVHRDVSRVALSLGSAAIFPLKLSTSVSLAYCADVLFPPRLGKFFT